MNSKKSIKLKGDMPDWIKKLSAAELIAQQKAFSETKFCATKDCNETNFQWCHVIPESSQLKQIAESNEVSWLPMREKDRWTLNKFWEQTSISKALVFKGFCNKCDNNLFKKIDSQLVFDKESFLLLAYRASCYFNWRYEVDLNTLKFSENEVKEMLKKNPDLPRLKNSFDNNHQNALKFATARRDNVKNMLDLVREAVDKKNYDFIKTKVYDFNEELPVRYSLAGTFVTSLLNEETCVSQNEHPQMPMLFLHILSEGNSTKLIFSWLSSIPNRFPEKWLNQFDEFSKSGHLADVLLRFMFISNHGLVFRPSFQNNFRHESSNYLTAPLLGQVYLDLKPEITRICIPPYFQLKWKLEDITTSYD